VLVITGAGISADSGVPTFRGIDAPKFDYASLATQKGLHERPLDVWRWYSERRRSIRAVQPNAAHRALVELQKNCTDFMLITQNVDGLDGRAGMPPLAMVQIHGDLFSEYCRNCRFKSREGTEHAESVPLCPRCAGVLGPGVVLFDEEFYEEDFARVREFLGRGYCELVVVVGTSLPFKEIVDWVDAVVGPATKLIEINPEETALSTRAHALRERAAVAVPRLVSGLLGASE